MVQAQFGTLVQWLWLGLRLGGISTFTVQLISNLWKSFSVVIIEENKKSQNFKEVFQQLIFLLCQCTGLTAHRLGRKNNCWRICQYLIVESHSRLKATVFTSWENNWLSVNYCLHLLSSCLVQQISENAAQMSISLAQSPRRHVTLSTAQRYTLNCHRVKQPETIHI